MNEELKPFEEEEDTTEELSTAGKAIVISFIALAAIGGGTVIDWGVKGIKAGVKFVKEKKAEAKT